MMRALIVTFGVVLLLGKLAMAGRLGLFGDEAFYWQCGQHPSLCYVDHPAVTAMLVRAGTELAGDTPLGVRLPFWLLGVLLPFVMYHLARPVIGREDAWYVAGACLVLPPVAHVGALAVPDGALIVLSALYLLAIERATRTRATGLWVLTGLVGMVGLMTHYRFVLFPLAGLLYLVGTRRGREHWRTAGPWIAVLLSLPGFLPAILFNLRTDLASVGYYLSGRHGLHFSLRALGEYLAIQVLFVTPLLAIALAGAFMVLVRASREGSAQATLLLAFAVVPSGVYLLASPFESSGLVTVHWPAHAYLPLLLFLPRVIRSFVRARPGPLRRGLAILTPGIPALLMLAVLLETTTGVLEIEGLRDPFVGSAELAARLEEEYLERVSGPDGRAIIVASDYKLAAQLDMRLHGRADVYVLDAEVNRAHGRGAQFAEWDLDAAGLERRAGESALVVVALPHEVHKEELVDEARPHFTELRPAGTFRVRKPSRGRERYWRFEFYEGTVKGADPSRG